MARGNALDAVGDSRQRNPWGDQNMNVIGHDHKGMEGVLVESRFSFMKCLDDVDGDSRIFQPKRTCCSFVEGGVQDLEAAAGWDFGGTDTLGCAGLLYERGREGIVESPGKKDRLIFGMPVWEIAAVEGHGGVVSIIL